MKWKRQIQLFLVLDLVVLFTVIGIRMHILVQEQNERVVVSSEDVILASDMKPKIALTFDDGPHPIYTPELLDGLKERNVRATFL